MFLSYLVLFIAVSLSAIAAWYSIIGLTAIFAAAVIPIIIMGGALEIAKVVITVWLHQYWRLCRPIMKTYLVPAVFFLMLLTSMGIFGFLSKAHLDQAIPTGDVQAKLSLVDEKIKTQKDNIEAARKALRQMDEAVDQTMARSQDEKGADKAAALRRNQARERGTLQADVGRAQAEIARLNEVRAPIASEVRKVEAEVGPVKYIAALIYGDNPDTNLLEKAVRWVIIIIVAVFDPLAIMMVLAATESLEWHRRGLVKRFKNGEEVAAPGEKSYERKFTNFVDGLAENSRGLVASLKSRFQRKKPISEPTSVVAELQPAEPYALRSNISVQPDDTSSIPAVGSTEPVQSPERPQVIYVGDADEEDPVNEHVAKVSDKPTAEELKEKAVEEIKEEVKEVVPEVQTLEIPEDLDSQYIAFNGKLWRREALMSMHPELWQQRLRATPDSDPSNVRFGVEWPKFAQKGDQFLRVDYLPTKLFKYNGRAWIEIDKNSTDTYTYDQNYIEYLIDKISSGEYDPELLSDGERAELSNILARDITLKR